MRTQMLIIIAVLVLTLLGVPAAAQSTSELLEKGIFLEETVGDVDRAIEVYSRIVDDAATHRPHVAEALFRLGMCHLKNDDAEAAAEVFETILDEYPDQEVFCARARDNMPDDPEELEMLPAPWHDGEVMRLTLKLTSGTPIGTMMMTADSADVDGKAMWRLRVRRRIFSDADNQAISEVLVRADTMAPLRSVFKHTVVGHFEAEYTDGKAVITTVGPGTVREQELEGRVFDNESGFHLFRRFPLAVGYKAKIRVLPPLAGAAIAVDVEIPDKEMITVPARDRVARG